MKTLKAWRAYVLFLQKITEVDYAEDIVIVNWDAAALIWFLFRFCKSARIAKTRELWILFHSFEGIFCRE